MRSACLAARGRPGRRRREFGRVVPAARSGSVLFTASQTAMLMADARYNGSHAEVGGYGDGLFSRSSGDRAIPYTVPMKVVQPQCCTSGAITSSTFGCQPQGRLWIAQPACSCACVAASRSRCVPTAITVSCIAAHRARPLGATNTVGTAPGATRTAAAAGSSMRRARLAGVNVNAACACPAQSPTPMPKSIK